MQRPARPAPNPKMKEHIVPRDTRDVADLTSDPATAATGNTAVLYRMALPNHLCPAGQKARWLLEGAPCSEQQQSALTTGPSRKAKQSPAISDASGEVRTVYCIHLLSPPPKADIARSLNQCLI